MRQASQTEARRKDTREKIQLGGLIAKAGLRYEKRALLLGLLDRRRRPHPGRRDGTGPPHGARRKGVRR